MAIPSPYVSIVSGTYNRLPHLKRMISSVRMSVGLGIPYEIILVDGGSTDGTIEWIKFQPDIVPILQGELLGAVKAFNAGASKARGKYVILANDDIEFRYESIQRGISFMDDDPTIGIGCFPQNRHNPDDYTCDKMPAVRNGVREWIYYGQVCIIPKWLGDKVGWWGTLTRTYAGDNEMSCNVTELGYRIEPIECACINDYELKDKLREINNPVQHGVSTGHPDGTAWSNKWTRNGQLGPIIQTTVSTDKTRVDRPKRIVYAPLYEEEEFPGQLKTKFGLRKALGERYLVTEVNYRKSPDDIYYATFMLKPDVVLIQYHDPRVFSYDLMMRLKDENPKTKFVSWNGDYNTRVLMDRSYMMTCKLFDVASFCVADIVPDYLREGINVKYWQIGYEDYTPLPDSKVERNRFDITFQGNCYSKPRQILGEFLRSHKEWNVSLYGKWPSHIGSQGITQYDFVAGDAAYRSSKIALGDNQYPKSVGYISNRVFQMLHAGAFVLQQEFVGMEEFTGITPEEHLITWKDLADLEEKIDIWLPREHERRNIAENGRRFVDQNHSFRNRVDEFDKMIEELDKK